MPDTGLWSRVVRLWRLAEALGLNPGSETVAKILVLQDMLREGCSVHRALDRVGLAWKNYYKYSPLIYSDPHIPIPLPKKFLRDHAPARLDLEGLRTALNEVAKHVAIETVKQLLIRGRISREELGMKWLKTAQTLIMTWIHEVCVELVGNNIHGIDEIY